MRKSVTLSLRDYFCVRSICNVSHRDGCMVRKVCNKLALSFWLKKDFALGFYIGGFIFLLNALMLVCVYYCVSAL